MISENYDPAFYPVRAYTARHRGGSRSVIAHRRLTRSGRRHQNDLRAEARAHAASEHMAIAIIARDDARNALMAETDPVEYLRRLEYYNAVARQVRRIEQGDEIDAGFAIPESERQVRRYQKDYTLTRPRY